MRCLNGAGTGQPCARQAAWVMNPAFHAIPLVRLFFGGDVGVCEEHRPAQVQAEDGHLLWIRAGGPHDLTAERALLGFVLVYGVHAEHVSEALSSEDFFVDEHAMIYRAALRCGPADSVAAAVRESLCGLRAPIATSVLIAALIECAAHPEHAQQFAEHVREAALLRRAS